MEMVSSCMQETIRLNTSEESFILPTSVIRDAKGTSTPGYLIPGGSRVICATRAVHLSDAIWGNNPSIWDKE
jgi:cytochrome P450